MISSGVHLVAGIVVASLLVVESSSCSSVVAFSRMLTPNVHISASSSNVYVAFVAVFLVLVNAALAFVLERLAYLVACFVAPIASSAENSLDCSCSSWHGLAPRLSFAFALTFALTFGVPFDVFDALVLFGLLAFFMPLHIINPHVH